MNTNSADSYPTPAPAPSRVTLTVRGMGPVPAYKNSKLLCRGKLITKPEYKKWMEQCIRRFECQLTSSIATGDGEMETEEQRRSRIASSVPADDCWTAMAWGHIRGHLVPKGQEGATITIERL